MRLRLLVLLAVVLAAAAPAWAELGSSRSTGLRGRIAAARAREDALGAEIADVTARMRALEARVGDVSTRLATLQEDVALHRRRLDAVQSLLAVQTRQLRFLRREHAQAVKRLEERVVAIYEAGEPSTLEVLLASRNFDEVLDQVDYMRTVALQDRRVASEVAAGRDRMRSVRSRTAKVEAAVASETRVIEYRIRQHAELRARLVASQGGLAAARDGKQRELASVQAQEAEWVAEANALAAPSSRVAAQIQSAQTDAPPPPSASGFAWPVSGPITSPFGMRWGSLHPGIDIGVGEGTPIHASAAGRVVVAAYSGGYGNLVVIDHGGGIATAYAHQSRLAVSVEQQVAQGDVVGYVGSTGFSTGPHLHFEVRVNGSPVDPMGYL